MTSPTVYLVGVDGTPISAHALEVASTLGAALGENAELHVVHVLPVNAPVPMIGIGPLANPGSYDREVAVLDVACADAGAHFKGKITGHLRIGEPWREIVQMAASIGADLVIVGTKGRTGIARLALGSVAESVVRHAGCPVLVVRPKDHHTHVEPTIEPPCSACVEVQNRTARAELWCAQHGAHHPRGRLHYELPAPFAVGSMNLSP